MITLGLSERLRQSLATTNAIESLISRTRHVKRNVKRRLGEARFPEVKTLDTFDFTTADGISATQIHTLARG